MSDHWLRISPVFHPLLTLTILMVVSILLIWKEAKRKFAFQSLRIIAQVLMMLALAGLLFRPEIKTAESTAIILLTPEYNTQQVDSLLQLNPTFSLRHIKGTKAYKGSTPLESFHALNSMGHKIRFIMGEGLPDHALALFDNKVFQFLPAPYPVGIIQLTLPGQILPHKKNKVEGFFNNHSSASTLYLEGPGGKEDSVLLSGEKIHPFTLSFIPRQAGKFLYTITIKDSHSKTEKQSLPIYVNEEVPLNLFFIQHAPTFETQYLKSFLSNHHSLLLRYQLSKNIFRYAFINRKPQRIDTINEEVLQSSDLLFIDSDAFKALPNVERKALIHAVQSGLGVIMLFNETPVNIKTLRSFLPINFKAVSSDTAQLSLPDSKLITLPAWPVITEPTSFVFPVTKNKSKILSGYTYNGFGKAGFQLLEETYRLALAGDSAGYAAIWTDLIEHIARKKDKLYTISTENIIPVYTDEPVVTRVIASAQAPAPVLRHDGVRIPLREDLVIDNVWHGKAWTSEEGWHTLMVDLDSSQLSYYISKKREWRSLRSAQAIQNTLTSTTDAGEKHPHGHDAFQPVSMVLFYILFLVSAGFLWFFPKL